VPDWRFPGLTGLEACDAFNRALAAIANIPVPPRIERRRSQLTDAMVDCQFQLGGARIAIAADPDLLATLTRFLTGMGAEIVAAVASTKAAHLSELPIENVVVGDLEDLEWLARERCADMIVTNSHGAEIARRLGTALLRAGFPIYDSHGAQAETFVGYGGSRRTLFRIADLLAANYEELRPYCSRLRQQAAGDAEIRRMS
jgi:nitrogenase molybdenum-iron protein NifN